MKKFLLLFVAVATILFVNQALAQCAPPGGGTGNCDVVPNITASVIQSFSETPTTCNATLNIEFNLSFNNGMKFINLYFFNNNIPAAVCGTAPSTTNANGLGGYIALERSSAGVFSKIAVTLNNLTAQAPATYELTVTPLVNGSNHSTVSIRMEGVVFQKPAPCDVSTVYLYLGATNANSNGVQCYNSASFTPVPLFATGIVNCSNPRSFTLNLTTSFPVAVTGAYDAVIDENRNGRIDPAELRIVEGRSFTTVVSAAGNRFDDFNVPYPPLADGDMRSSAPVLVRVMPTTPGVAPVTGRLSNGCGTLPVSFVMFNAHAQQGRVVLSWETGTESNNKGFEVQRRVNGNPFETIGFVPTRVDAGTGSGASYQFEDRSNMPGGILYYRLRQIDFNGGAIFSDIRLIRFNTKNLVVGVFPNPSSGTSQVVFPENAGPLDISLEDFSGKLLQRWSAYGNKILQINNLKPGMYVLRIQVRATGEQLAERIMVQ